MTFARFKTPGGVDVAVRCEDIFAAVPDVATPADDTDLFWDSARSLLALEPLQQVGAKLGAAFVEMPAASTTLPSFFVNRRLVTAVIPHPQHADVCFLQGAVRRLATKGSFDEVMHRLEGG